MSDALHSLAQHYPGETSAPITVDLDAPSRGQNSKAPQGTKRNIFQYVDSDTELLHPATVASPLLLSIEVCFLLASVTLG